MDTYLKYIFQQVSEGKLDKGIAANLINLAKEDSTEDIAIIGMGLRFPGADNTKDFWSNLKNGWVLTREFPEDRQEMVLDYLKFKTGDTFEKDEMKFFDGYYLDEIDTFDYSFFNITPKQASLMDPNQRLMLESIYRAIEDSGYVLEDLKGSSTGVYVGYANSPVATYGLMVYETDPEAAQISLTGNLPAIMPSRSSFMFDFKGPSILIDTACSSSLVAIHLACQGISKGDCEMAVVGGVKTHLTPSASDDAKIGIESSDGITKAFDDISDGTGMGEGSGAVVLKSLKKAVLDKDHIYAVIKGSAINQDGNTSSITAPNAFSQSEVILEAWERARVNPENIFYIEAHGTGTQIGDPIELDGIKMAFSKHTNRKQFCGIGTVKNNIGHLFEGSGIASLIKSALSLYNREIPKHPNFNRPNKNIDFYDSPVYICDESIKWDKEKNPRIMGISAFGFSGTNCHLILEEPPSNTDEEYESEKPDVLCISAKNEETLQRLCEEYIEFITPMEETVLKRLCYSAYNSRKHYEIKLSIVFDCKEDLIKKINEWILSKRANETQGIFFKNCEDANDEQDHLDSGSRRYKCISFSRNYINGNKPDVSLIYSKMRKIPVPLYPFDRKKCVLHIPECDKKLSRKIDKQMYYTTFWCKENKELQKNNNQLEKCLIFHNNDSNSKSIIDSIKESAQNVYDVVFGDDFIKNNNSYTIRSNEEDMDRLIKDISILEVTHIVYMTALSEKDIFENTSEIGSEVDNTIIGLFHLVRSIGARTDIDNINLILITCEAFRVCPTQKNVSPLGTALVGLGRVIPRECPAVTVGVIDIDREFDENFLVELVKQDVSDYPVAIRDNQIYYQEFRKAHPESVPGLPMNISKDGVYIITGGLGGIGLEVSKWIASKQKTTLVMINRSKIPEEELWDTIIAENKDIKTINKIISVREIQKLGSKVVLANADIADESTLPDVIESIRNTYGPIKGVIHGAGISGDNVMLFRKEMDFKKVLSPKINGTVLLENITRNDPLDFFVVFSSVASIFSSPGQGDYAAANSFLDGFSDYMNSKGRRALSINWVAWKEVGMAVDSKANVDTSFKAILTKEAMDCFEKAIMSSYSKILIGEINYDGKLAYLLESHMIKLSKEISENILLTLPNTKKVKGKDKASIKVQLTGRDGNTYSDTEKKIAQIWSDAFGFEKLSIKDNFYDMGGDSILAMRIVSVISKNFNITMNIKDILNYLTIEELAVFIESKIADADSNVEVKESLEIKQYDKADFYPLSAPQRRLYFIEKASDTKTSYNMPGVVAIDFSVTPKFIEEVFNKIIKRHDSFRTYFTIINNEAVQIVLDEVEFKLEYEQINEDELGSVVKDFVKPFDLTKPPLLRAKLLKQNDERYILLFDMHHIISDGISIKILVDDFVKISNLIELEPLKLHYKDFALWQNEMINKKEMLNMEKYWLNELKDLPSPIGLPLDFERPEIKSFDGDYFVESLDNNIKDRILELSSTTGVSSYMILMAVFAILLNKYSGQRDIIIGTAVSGRQDKISDIIGFFVNSLPLRFYVDEDLTFKEFLKNVKDKVLGAFENQSFPFDMLVEKLNVKRDLSRNPIFDTAFAYQSQSENSGNKELTDSILPKKSKFDMTLYINDYKDTLELMVEYSISLFKRETCIEFLRRYKRCLLEVLLKKDIHIKDINLISSVEREKVKKGIQEGSKMASILLNDDFD